MTRVNSVQLPDGRVRDVFVGGAEDPGAPAIVFHHGTPSAAEHWPAWVTAAADAGLRWVSATRPGYGGSSRRAGRSVADDVDDVAALLDTLGIDRFVAMGWSGGGPHALACGARLAGRCAGVVTLAGVAPSTEAQAAGLDWLDGMGPENHEEFGAAAAGEEPLRAFLDAQREGMVDITGEQVGEALGGLVDTADLAVLTGEFADAVAASFREAVRPGVDGWCDDDLAFVRDWGFALADVAVPVSVWQGDQDRMVPQAHGPFLAERLPQVVPHFVPGEGHLSIPLARFDAVLADVRTFLAG